MPEREGRGTGENAKLAAAGVLVLLLILFVVANREDVKVDFLVTDIEVPLVVVLVGTAAVGAIAAILVTQFRHRH